MTAPRPEFCHCLVMPRPDGGIGAFSPFRHATTRPWHPCALPLFVMPRLDRGILFRGSQKGLPARRRAMTRGGQSSCHGLTVASFSVVAKKDCPLGGGNAEKEGRACNGLIHAPRMLLDPNPVRGAVPANRLRWIFSDDVQSLHVHDDIDVGSCARYRVSLKLAIDDIDIGNPRIAHLLEVLYDAITLGWRRIPFRCSNW